MHFKLFAVAALGLLGQLHAQCATSASNPTPSANPGTLTVCYTSPAVLAAAGTITVTPQPTGVFIAANPVITIGASAGAGCTGSTTDCTAARCVVTLAGTCTIAVGTVVPISFTTNLGVNPASGLQYFTIFSSASATNVVTSYAVGSASPSPIQPSAGTVCSTVNTLFPTAQSVCSATQTTLTSFANAAQGISATGQGSATCAASSWSTWVFAYLNPGWEQTVTSTGARSVTIKYWGNMLTTQMTAIAITYPVTASNLQLLNLNAQGYPSNAALVPNGATPEFLVTISRVTTAGVLANDANPVHFIVAAGNGRPISQVIVTNPCSGSASAVEGASGAWAYSASGATLVMAASGGTFVGYSTAYPSPSPIDEGSDEALLGLLALLALPFMLCCCIALCCWHKAKNAPFPCRSACQGPCQMQECDMQNMVPIQTIAPVQMGAPPCTPIFPMPYY